MTVSHVGLRVRDLEKSKEFFEALGFAEATTLSIPDQVAAEVVPLAPPIGFRAAYLSKGPFVLQLLTFSGYPAPDAPDRSMVDAGLTHISIAVDDVAAALSDVRAAGGTVVVEPAGGWAAIVRTPEGQLIEFILSGVMPVPQV